MQPADRTENFLTLLSRHERLITTYVLTLVPHWSDADDILQETKLVMWREFEKFETGTNFGAWACKIAFHRVLTHRKKAKKRGLPLSEEGVQAVSEEWIGSMEHYDRRQEALLACMESLTDDHRRIVRMRYYEGMDVPEIARRAGRTMGALYRVLSRIRRSLHECVNQTIQEGAAP